MIFVMVVVCGASHLGAGHVDRAGSTPNDTMIIASRVIRALAIYGRCVVWWRFWATGLTTQHQPYMFVKFLLTRFQVGEVRFTWP